MSLCAPEPRANDNVVSLGQVGGLYLQPEDRVHWSALAEVAPNAIAAGAALSQRYFRQSFFFFSFCRGRESERFAVLPGVCGAR